MGAVVGAEEKKRYREEQEDHGTKVMGALMLSLLTLAVLGSLLGAIFSIWGWRDLDGGCNGCCVNNTQRLDNLTEIINHIKYNSTLQLCTNIYNIMLPLLITDDASCWRFGEELFYDDVNPIAITIVANDVDLSGNGYKLRVEENRTGIATSGFRSNIHDLTITSLSGQQNFYAGSGGIVAVLAGQTFIKNVHISYMQTGLLSFLAVDTEMTNFNVLADASGGPGLAPQEGRVVAGVRCIDSDRCVVRDGFIVIGDDPDLVTLGLSSETFLLGRTRGFRAQSITAFAGDVALVVTGSEAAYVGGASYFETRGGTNTAIACWVGDPFSEDTSSVGATLENVVCKNNVNYGDALFLVNAKGVVIDHVFAYQHVEIATLTGAFHVGFSQLGADVGEYETAVVSNSYFEATLQSPNVVVESQAGSIRFEHNVVRGGNNGLTILTNFSTFEKNTIHGHVGHGIYVGNDFFNAGHANLIEQNHVSKSCISAIKLGPDTKGNQAVNNRLTWNTADVIDLGTGNLVEDNKMTPALELLNCTNFNPDVGGQAAAAASFSMALSDKLDAMRVNTMLKEQGLAVLMATAKMMHE